MVVALIVGIEVRVGCVCDVYNNGRKHTLPYADLMDMLTTCIDRKTAVLFRISPWSASKGSEDWDSVLDLLAGAGSRARIFECQLEDILEDSDAEVGRDLCKTVKPFIKLRVVFYLCMVLDASFTATLTQAKPLEST